LPEFVERASEFFVDRVAPRLIGRRGRVPQHDMEALERQAREELEARIQRGRPAPEEWPGTAPADGGSPEPAFAPAVRPPVRVAAALRVFTLDVDLPTPASAPSSRPSPAPVSPTSN
jgi:hypothetical protein